MKDLHSWGEQVASLRRERVRQTLRAFCAANDLDPGNWSKMERGLRPPPSDDEKLAEYAGFLGIEQGSDEEHEFFEAASIARGEIPPTILQNEELVRRLPAFFRSMRMGAVNRDDLDRLIEVVRRH